MARALKNFELALVLGLSYYVFDIGVLTSL